MFTLFAIIGQCWLCAPAKLSNEFSIITPHQPSVNTCGKIISPFSFPQMIDQGGLSAISCLQPFGGEKCLHRHGGAAVDLLPYKGPGFDPVYGCLPVRSPRYLRGFSPGFLVSSNTPKTYRFAGLIGFSIIANCTLSV